MIKLFFLFLLKDFNSYLLDSNKSWFAISFFLLCVLIFPLTYGSSVDLLKKTAIASIWICALFSNLISLESLFKEDYQNGVLLQYRINKIPFSIIVVTKCISHWVFTGLPIIFFSPIFLIFLSGSSNDALGLFFSLLFGTPLFSLVGMPIAALTLGATARGPLLIFLTIPFFFPIIIFGVLGVNSFNKGFYSEYYLLCAILSISIVILPYITIKILQEILK